MMQFAISHCQIVNREWQKDVGSSGQDSESSHKQLCYQLVK